MMRENELRSSEKGSLAWWTIGLGVARVFGKSAKGYVGYPIQTVKAVWHAKFRSGALLANDCRRTKTG